MDPYCAIFSAILKVIADAIKFSTPNFEETCFVSNYSASAKG